MPETLLPTLDVEAQTDLTQADPTQAGPTQADPTQAGPAQSDPTQAGPAQSDPTQADPASPVTWIDNVTPEVAAAWYPVALSSEVGHQPVAVELLGRHWVVARLGGELVAFVDQCPHRLMPLSAGTICDQTLRCAYHGWEFDPTGTAVAIPSLDPGTPITARARLTAPAGLVERYGAVWMAPEVPVTDLPPFPEWDDATFEGRIDPPQRLTAGYGQVMDNSCDTTHFVSVHAGTFGGDATAHVQARTITRQGWTLTATYETPYRVLDDPRVTSGEFPELQPSTQTKSFHLGATLHLRMEFPLTGSVFTVFVSAQPEHDGSTRLYRWCARNDIVGDEARWEACLENEAVVLAEDFAALTRYRDHRLPLDLRREVHVPADRLSLAYRRVLIDFVNRPPAARPTDPPAGDPSTHPTEETI